MKPDINRLIEFQQLLVSLSQIDRMVHRRRGDSFVAENDTEHSYNLAMTAWYVAQYFPDLDVTKVLKYALAHDLVEVHAGDTYIYASSEELATKKQREAEAVKKLQQEWADFAELHEIIHGYEERADPEARFVYALDKIMPIMLVYINEGYSWEQQSVTAAMLHEAKIDKVSLSPEILPYFEALHELLLSRPDIIKRS